MHINIEITLLKLLFNNINDSGNKSVIEIVNITPEANAKDDIKIFL